MPKWIDHIVVRVNDINESLKDYEEKLGMKASKGPDAVPNLGMTRAILPLGDEGRFIEIAEPLGDGGAIVTDDVSAADLNAFLTAIVRQYSDEVDDARSPDQDGLVGSLDRARAALEIEARTNLAHGALDGVVDLRNFGA